MLKLGIGTAQFGMDYGATNATGQINQAGVLEILDFCADNDIEIVDTAEIYGTAENVLGACFPQQTEFKIVTKFHCTQPDHRTAEGVLGLMNGALDRLNKDRVYGTLLHHAPDLTGPDGDQIWKGMERAKDLGLTQKIGVSTYTPEDVELITDRYAIDLIQLPINLIDQRLVQRGLLAKLKSQGVEVHARSLFLQGLLLNSPDQLPNRLQGFQADLQSTFEKINANKLSPMEACLGFVCNQPEIDVAVVGVSSLDELKAIVEVFRDVVKTASPIAYADFSSANDILLNPAAWPAA